VFFRIEEISLLISRTIGMLETRIESRTARLRRIAVLFSVAIAKEQNHTIFA
jgi:hypothetical protein